MQTDFICGCLKAASRITSFIKSHMHLGSNAWLSTSACVCTHLCTHFIAYLSISFALMFDSPQMAQELFSSTPWVSCFMFMNSLNSKLWHGISRRHEFMCCGKYLSSWCGSNQGCPLQRGPSSFGSECCMLQSSHLTSMWGNWTLQLSSLPQHIHYSQDFFWPLMAHYL